jgi:hypothetical protein
MVAKTCWLASTLIPVSVASAWDCPSVVGVAVAPNSRMIAAKTMGAENFFENFGITELLDRMLIYLEATSALPRSDARTPSC